MPALSKLTLVACAAWAACTLVPPAAAQTAASGRLAPLVDEIYPRLEALYQDLHAHPELGFQETRTAAALAAQMRALGFEVTEGVGRTGVVALYRNGSGPTVLVRTELDALPMEEKTGLPYASRARTMSNGRETFVAHSCGHDVHMAAWVGAARAISEAPESRLMRSGELSAPVTGSGMAPMPPLADSRMRLPPVTLTAPLPATALISEPAALMRMSSVAVTRLMRRSCSDPM